MLLAFVEFRNRRRNALNASLLLWGGSSQRNGQKKRESYKDVLFLRGIAIALVPQQQRQYKPLNELLETATVSTVHGVVVIKTII